MSNMEGLDPKSIEFIFWLSFRVEKKWWWLKFRLRVLYLFIKFIFFQNHYVLKDRLIAKVKEGGRQHGSPIYQVDYCYQELEAEFIDSLGWPAIGEWNKKQVV